MSYIIRATQSGIEITAQSSTLAGAKREASAWITHGGGDVYILENGNPICCRTMWQNWNSFGWSKWTVVNA